MKKNLPNADENDGPTVDETVPVNEEAEEKKQAADLEKVELEIKTLNNSLQNFAAQQKLERTKVWLTFVTSSIAIIGLALTFYFQRGQLLLIQNQHLDDDYSKRIELLAKSTNEQAKLAAILNLSIYFKASYADDIQDRVLRILIYEAELDSSIAVKKSIREQLVNNIPAKTLTFLIDQGRGLKKEFNNSLVSGDEASMDGADKLISHELNWSMVTITECLNHLRTVSDMDFSHMVFSRVFYAENKDSTSFNNYNGTQITGVTFNNITFDDSELSGMTFENCTFNNVRFDNANMILTKFQDCKFSKSCSFKRFKWDTENGYGEITLEHSYPKWERCEIAGTCFSPLDTAASGFRIYTGDLFIKSRWRFDTLETTNKIHISQATGSNIQ
jgi:uncharacterized protein YjbI with pentapeptide repeats